MTGDHLPAWEKVRWPGTSRFLRLDDNDNDILACNVSKDASVEANSGNLSVFGIRS